MPPRERLTDRADRLSSRTLVTIGREIREARISAGLSQGVVARAAGLSASRISRVERAEVRTVSVQVLTRLCVALGLDLSLRAFPAGDPIRDAAHVRLLERFRTCLHASLRWRTEVPLPIAGDRRAWDAVIRGAAWSIPVEAETRVADVQAVVRRLAIKLRDGGFDQLVLVVADTRANRASVDAAGVELAQMFPLSARTALAALRAGTDPGGSALLLL